MSQQVFTDKALAGKATVITGASRGIGAAILEAFIKTGAKVVGTATTQDGAQKITDHIKALGGEGTGMVLNIADRASVDDFVTEAEKYLGTVSVLVNNAGITRDTLAIRMKDDAWDEVINTNLTGTFRLSRNLIRGMMKARKGCILYLSSVVGMTGNAGQANYAASKAGIIGLCKSLARELAPRGITVNCIAPGFIETDMTSVLSPQLKESLLKQIPLGRLGTPEDIANAAVFLASSAASYITGQVIEVNGGMRM